MITLPPFRDGKDLSKAPYHGGPITWAKSMNAFVGSLQFLPSRFF